MGFETSTTSVDTGWLRGVWMTLLNDSWKNIRIATPKASCPNNDAAKVQHFCLRAKTILQITKTATKNNNTQAIHMEYRVHAVQISTNIGIASNQVAVYSASE